MKFYAFVSGFFLLASLTWVQSARVFQPLERTSSHIVSSAVLQSSSALTDSGKRGGLSKVGSVPQVSISTPSYPIGIQAKETQWIPYQLQETAHGSGEITSRTYQFFTQYGVPLSEKMGPFLARIHVRSANTTVWNERVYLPQHVVDKARSRRDYAFVLKTTFDGMSESGEAFSTESSLLLLLPPDSFSKSTPVNGAQKQPTDASLHWDSTVGAVDYEYCFDMYDNDYCDGGWTGTYWLGTYDTDAALKKLPAGTTFYWQVRANNLAGSTYANNGEWWSFTTACSTNLITVTKAYDSGTGSLRQAIADICPGGTIKFHPSLSGKTIRLQSTLFIYKDLTIDGSALTSKIRISGMGQVTVFRVPNFTVTLKNLIITQGNSGGEAGGGIQNGGTLNIVNSLISENHGGFGGGIQNLGTLHLRNSIVINNTASEGAGILNSGILTVSYSTFSGNTAGRGGAIISVGSVYIRNSTFFGNSSGDEGGAILSYGLLDVKNSTFSNNSAVTFGGGIYLGNGTFSLVNTILASSLSGADCYRDNNNVKLGSNINNLIEKNASSPNACGTPAFTTDPKLGPLTNHGGPTQTMALLSGSLAINNGNDTNCPFTDQRGVKRPQGAHCDIGAYEALISFTDVAPDYWAWDFVERLYSAGVTGGCGTDPLRYCPAGAVTRAQMAIFLLKGIHGSSYSPPAVGGSTGFGDVQPGHWAAAWIKQLAAEKITSGCGSGNYCPDAPVTRAQMAVFLLKAKHGTAYMPPVVGSSTGFSDVPTDHWAAKWIRQLAAEGITGGCGNGQYCPDTPVTRAQMAVFLVKTFNLP